MRRALVALFVAVVVGLTVAGTAGGDRSAKRISLPAGLSVRVPAGWRMLHGWLSDVVDPAPSLAVASFPARLSRETCACGSPNVVHFPRDGAFIFAWEYLHPQPGQLASTPRRPAHFSLSVSRAVRQTCYGPNAEAIFKDARRVFQVEIYIGPAAGRALRAQVTQILDSLRVARARRRSRAASFPW